jgi:hypothetical protein
MNIALTERAAALTDAPLPVQAFIKQIGFLARNLTHPSLRAKSTAKQMAVGKRGLMTTGDSTSQSTVMRIGSTISFLTRNDRWRHRLLGRLV